jgi:hypothetical protein
MVDPVTPNVGLFVPLRGTDQGTWDVPVNTNFNELDFMFGGVTTYTPTNTNIIMASTAAQAAIIRLTGTLTGPVAITMASSFNKFWTVDNQLTNAPSSYYVIFVSTSGTQWIGAPPGCQDIYYDGTSVRYRSLPHPIGEFWDYADVVVPSWVSQSTVPPYLYCNGGTFNATTYPVLAGALYGNTLPDTRGRYRAAWNDGTGRITAAGGGVNGDLPRSFGGAQNFTIANSNLPAAIPYNDTGHSHTVNNVINSNAGVTTNISISGVSFFDSNVNTTTVGVGITINSGSPNSPISELPPTYMGGITMIRAGG